MKTYPLGLALVASLFFCACAKKDLRQASTDPVALVNAGPASSDDPYKNGNFLVEPATGTSLADAGKMAAALGATILRTEYVMNFVLVSSSDANFRVNMEAKAGIASVTPSYTMKFLHGEKSAKYSTQNIKTMSGPGSTNPLFFLQWGHQAIQSPDAWALGYKGDGARVAVCDAGFFPHHPDLEANVNFTLSKNFVAGEALEQAFAGFSHGTHTAGIVAALDNEIGVVGVAPDAELVLVKVLSDEGYGSFEDVAAGIIYSADCKADIISLSLAGYIPRSLKDISNDIRVLINFMNKAIKYATQKGSTVICAASNESVHPSAYGYLISPVGSPGSIGVSAVAPRGWIDNPSTNLDEFASYSNFGIDIVDLSASGGDFAYWPNDGWWFDMVLSTSDYSDYYYAAGTSMACPQAAGVGALIISRYGKMSPALLKTKLQQTSDDLGKKGNDPYFGAGRVNAWRAVK